MFISDKFIFNNIHSDDMNISLITLDSQVINKYGLDYTDEFNMVKKNKITIYNKGEQTESEDVVLLMALIDKDGIPMVWDDESLDNVYTWLLQEDFSPFVSEDNEELVYYLKVVKISKMFTYDKKGYLEVTFKPYSNLAYKNYSKTFTVNGETEVVLVNSSNIKDPQYPVIEIVNLGNELNIIGIENISFNNREFTIKNLEFREKVLIDCLMGTVFNSYGDNRLMDSNRSWVCLNSGKNILKVSGHAEISIKCQYPVRV